MQTAGVSQIGWCAVCLGPELVTPGLTKHNQERPGTLIPGPPFSLPALGETLDPCLPFDSVIRLDYPRHAPGVRVQLPSGNPNDVPAPPVAEPGVYTPKPPHVAEAGKEETKKETIPWPTPSRSKPSS